MAQPFQPGDDQGFTVGDDVIPPGTDPAAYPQLIRQAGYETLAATIELIYQEFPELVSSFREERVRDWIAELQGGTGRDEDQLRDEIFEFVVGPGRLQEKYGIDEDTAWDIILGGNEGGINFGEFLRGTDVGGDQTTRPGFTADQPDPEDEEGVGTPAEDDVPGMTIMTSQSMRWFFDDDANKWYVGYTLPGSGRLAVFEAEPDQMDLLFGDGQRPVGFEFKTLEEIVRDPLQTFAGNISEVEGVGQFEDHYHRMVALGLDGDTLPAWAAEDGAVLDILFLAETEDKSTDWVIQQISQTDSFKARFPGIEGIMSQANVSLGEAITGFLEMEAGVKAAVGAIGGRVDAVTPETIGALIEKGHSLTTVDMVTKTFDRMTKFAPAMNAFNGILAAQDIAPITDLQDMFDFMAGTAPQDLYDIWEASALSEAAIGAGLGEFFDADDAIQVALQTAGTLQTEQVTAAMRKSAELALRLRHELNMGEFDLSHEDLIDMQLGQPLRSGRSAPEVNANIQRVIARATAERDKARLQPFTGFTAGGVAQTRSFGSLRAGS